MFYNKCFLLVILIVLCSNSSAINNPPFENITSYNLNLANSLNDSYDPDNSVNGTIDMTFFGTDINWAPVHRSFDFPFLHASAKLLKVEPSVDNVFSGEDPYLIFVWGAQADPLIPKDWEKVPGLMGDDCVEEQYGVNVSRNALITFSFANISETVNTSSNIVPIPENIKNAMMDTSGIDPLNIKLNSSNIFTYTINDRIPTHSGCRENLVNFSSQINVYDELNWTIGGNKTLFFLRSPILNEQWFRNNQFNTIVFSNSKIYKAFIKENGVVTRNISLYSFNTTTDKYGLKNIISVRSNSSGKKISEHLSLNSPLSLSEDNSSFIYLYEFNHTYEGIGENILELEIISFSGLKSKYTQKILSRELTHSGNISEQGELSNESNSRKSKSPESLNIQNVELSFGIVGILILLLFIKRIIK
jgi:hypothetical protein